MVPSDLNPHRRFDEPVFFSQTRTEARLPLLCRVWQAVSTPYLPQRQRGKASVEMCKEGSHRALVRHAVLVGNGWCLQYGWYGGVRAKHRALKARNV